MDCARKEWTIRVSKDSFLKACVMRHLSCTMDFGSSRRGIPSDLRWQCKNTTHAGKSMSLILICLYR
jgi:hypothetical protein